MFAVGEMLRHILRSSRLIFFGTQSEVSSIVMWAVSLRSFCDITHLLTNFAPKRILDYSRSCGHGPAAMRSASGNLPSDRCSGSGPNWRAVLWVVAGVGRSSRMAVVFTGSRGTGPPGYIKRSQQYRDTVTERDQTVPAEGYTLWNSSLRTFLHSSFLTSLLNFKYSFQNFVIRTSKFVVLLI
jgi:hypothetical protein